MTTEVRPGPVMDLVRRHAARLERAGIASALNDALTLASHALGMSRSELRVRDLGDVHDDVLNELDGLIERRARRVPLQHLTGTAGFRRLTLACRPGVFVPRPETEILAGHAIGLAGPGTTVIEPCTGSGAVALSIAAEAPGTSVVATDRDRAAVELARRNASVVGVDVDVRLGDLLGPVDERLRGGVDVLVSNPPYLTPDEIEACEVEVREHDPVGALVAGPTGHEVTDRLIGAAPTWLRSGGTLLLEVAEVRAAEVARRARGAGLREVVILDDLTGRERIVRGVKP